MFEIKDFNRDKVLKDTKFLLLFSYIFGIMAFFDISRGFLTSDLFSFLNGMLFMMMFGISMIAEKVNRVRLDLDLKK